LGDRITVLRNGRKSGDPLPRAEGEQFPPHSSSSWWGGQRRWERSTRFPARDPQLGAENPAGRGPAGPEARPHAPVSFPPLHRGELLEWPGWWARDGPRAMRAPLLRGRPKGVRADLPRTGQEGFRSEVRGERGPRAAICLLTEGPQGRRASSCDGLATPKRHHPPNLGRVLPRRPPPRRGRAERHAGAGRRAPHPRTPLRGATGGQSLGRQPAEDGHREGGCSAEPRWLIFDEPTRGIGRPAARFEIYQLLWRLAARRARESSSSPPPTFPELMGICHRILVFFSNGRITGDLPRDQFSQERILACAYH